MSCTGCASRESVIIKLRAKIRRIAKRLSNKSKPLYNRGILQGDRFRLPTRTREAARPSAPAGLDTPRPFNRVDLGDGGGMVEVHPGELAQFSSGWYRLNWIFGDPSIPMTGLMWTEVTVVRVARNENIPFPASGNLSHVQDFYYLRPTGPAYRMDNHVLQAFPAHRRVATA